MPDMVGRIGGPPGGGGGGGAPMRGPLGDMPEGGGGGGGGGAPTRPGTGGRS